MFWIVNAEFAVPIWRGELESRRVGIAEESETTFSDQTGPSKRNGSGLPFFILFRKFYMSKEKWSNEPVCRNGTANFGNLKIIWLFRSISDVCRVLYKVFTRWLFVFFKGERKRKKKKKKKAKHWWDTLSVRTARNSWSKKSREIFLARACFQGNSLLPVTSQMVMWYLCVWTPWKSNGKVSSEFSHKC